ncbi:MAG: hypothetical protein IKZ09_01285, partial [Clostridia bacterium]|nr:hypothetical protein [Clostridia bacterium]
PKLLERIFVRSELTPYKSKKGTVSKVSIGAHYSGGIVMLFAKMMQYEYRFVALCAFENGKVRS